MDSSEILIALRRIMRAIELRSKRLEKSAGLTVPQLLVLQELAAAGELSVSEIARRISLSQGTVTSIVQRMEAKGLLQKHRSGQDRRRLEVALTEKGQDKLAMSPGLLQEEFVSRFQQLESWEQKMLTSALERIAEIMDAERMDASPILQVGEILTDKGGSGTG
jgi:DNA-binding MarR family transcriptional regulator